VSTADLPDAPVGLRERQKRARRAALVDAAQLLVERDGLDAVTVEAICAEAGVSTRTFFNYFESKDDAVLGMEPLSLDPDVARTFAAGGPTGDIAHDLEVLARSFLVAPVMSRQRSAAARELARREPRLIIRHVAWLERYRTEVESLLRTRLGAPLETETEAEQVARAAADPEAGDATERYGDRDALVEMAGMTLMVLVRSAMQRWEAAGGDGDVVDHLAAAKADLRTLLGDL
jgi:AcrR family transcriptional regulator